MDNHFGKGLMAGLNAPCAYSAQNAARFCSDYKRGFVLGFTHRMFEKTGDRQLSAWEAGMLTRRYGLDKDRVMDFFRENNSVITVRFFMAGYRLEG
ncbi:TPA: DUF2623 domain-containing protein [Salmonella enterica]|nr:DUF2623 domain-containing protein [Salmonella enterica]